MHSTTGTGKSFVGILSLMMLGCCIACNNPGSDETTDVQPKARVKITTVQHTSLDAYELVQATVVYLNKSDIVAPVSGYLTSVDAQTGYPVRGGQHLFSLETKEHRAIQGDTTLKDESLRKLGVFSVSAPAGGYITAVMHQRGDYVQEGTALCAFTRGDQIYVKAFVPVRLQRYVQRNQKCRIILPDNSELQGIVGETLPTLDSASQSLQVLIRPARPSLFLENMRVQVQLPVMHLTDAQVLPKSAVLSSEKLDKFWIMQLLNDSTAVRTPVTVGITRNDSIQITDPVFTKDSRILYEGSYGLPDTADVQVIR
jgi:biotin carboxyl carrier protein